MDESLSLTHRFFRKHCKDLANYIMVKDLLMLGRDLRQLILADDKPYLPENVFAVNKFNGDSNDTALFDITEFCKRLSESIVPSDRDIRAELRSYAQMLCSLNLHDQMLPPMAKSDAKMNKKTLVLDLDETLTHSTPEPPKMYDFAIEIQHPDRKCTYYVLKRPWVDKLLDELKSLCEIVVFTASRKQYADAILNKLDPHGNKIRHRLYRDSCTKLPGRKIVKDLSRLGRSLSKVIFVDDNCERHCQRENVYPLVKFIDDMNDTELLSLLDFCKQVAKSRRDTRAHILSLAIYPNNDGKKAFTIRS